MAQLTLDEAAQYLSGLKRSRNKGKPCWIGPCPLCGGTDRFMLDENEEGKVMWFCRVGGHVPPADQHDFWFADRLLDTLKLRPIDFTPDKDFVRPKYEPPKIEAPLWSELSSSPVQLTLDDAISYNRNLAPAIKYFGQFGLLPKTLDRFKIGYAVNPPHCSIPAGYSIPNLSYGPEGKIALRGMQLRRDEEACMAALKARGQYYMELQRNELIMKWTNQVNQGKRSEVHDPTDAELINHLYPKYSYISGSKPGIWGDDLVSLPGGERIGPRLSYIFMVEDAKSAMVLRQDGYPAVAYKKRKDWTAHLAEVFQRCAAVYIIADRDEGENNFGVGAAMAREFEAEIRAGGKSFTRIIMPPSKTNDVADLVRDHGFEAMRNWLGQKVPGLQPEWESET